jgi:rubredoxin
MRLEELCSECNTLHPSQQHRATFLQHGNPDRTEVPVGKGHWLEVSHYFKCPKCGAIWENLIESGAGGHGNFWNRIDPPPKKL